MRTWKPVHIKNRRPAPCRFGELVGSGTLLDTIEMLWSRSGPYLATVISMDDRLSVFSRASEMHDAIISAIEASDPTGAEEALVADINFAVEWYERQRSTMPEKH